MARAAVRFSLAVLGSVLVTACFVEPRPAEEIFDVPFPSDDFCNDAIEGACHDGNPCTRSECTSLQRCLHEPDDTLVPDDGQPCTVDVCSDGVARHEPAAAGTPCGLGGALQCDGKGACVGCAGDASACGEPASCLSWACQGDTCAPQPAPEGQMLPSSEQIEGDCGALQCDGQGGVETVLADDPAPDPYNSCGMIDCVTGQWSLRPEGSPCGTGCGISLPGRGVAIQFTCTAAGPCDGTSTSPCAIGYSCVQGGCRTSCTPETELTDCVPGATCEDGECVMQPGPIADCQSSCAAFAALGCPVDWSSPSCEDACLAITEKAVPGCYDLAVAYVSCLGDAAKTVTTCAEHRTSCASEYELYAECQGTLVPDGPGCSLLPCTASFDGCTCAAHCDDALVADHCTPAGDGTFTCTCAKDGATVATCPGAAGCGIEKGCCKGI